MLGTNLPADSCAVPEAQIQTWSKRVWGYAFDPGSETGQAWACAKTHRFQSGPRISVFHVSWTSKSSLDRTCHLRHCGQRKFVHDEARAGECSDSCLVEKGYQSHIQRDVLSLGKKPYLPLWYCMPLWEHWHATGRSGDIYFQCWLQMLSDSRKWRMLQMHSRTLLSFVVLLILVFILCCPIFFLVFRFRADC